MELEIKRRPPCPDYDIRGTEKWLAQMAARGYHLCEGHAFQGGFAYFIEGVPKTVRYRMDAAKTISQGLWGNINDVTPPDEETQRFHREFGWHYVTYRSQFHIYRCEVPSAPELHTDPRIQAISLEIVTKRQRSQLLWLLLYGLIWCLPRGELLCGILVHRGPAAFIPVLIFFALALAAWLPGMIHTSRFRRLLQRGILPESPKSASEEQAAFLRTLRSLPFLFLLFSLWLSFSNPSSHDGIYLDSPQKLDAPILTVAELFPEAEIAYNDPYGSHLAQWSTQSSPENYILRESFTLTLPDGTTTAGDWDLQWYETRFAWIARGYGLEIKLEDHFPDCSRGTTAIELNLPQADWYAAYHMDVDRVYGADYDVILLVQGNVCVCATLTIYDDSFPLQYTPQDLAQALLAAMSR